MQKYFACKGFDIFTLRPKKWVLNVLMNICQSILNTKYDWKNVILENNSSIDSVIEV